MAAAEVGGEVALEPGELLAEDEAGRRDYPVEGAVELGADALVLGRQIGERYGGYDASSPYEYEYEYEYE